MSDADRRKWDARYARADFRASAEASPFLQAHCSRITPGRALELACGAGRNAIYLAQQGFSVDAIDISEQGLQHARTGAERAGVEVNWMRADLLAGDAFPRDDYQLIVMTHFVAPRLLANLGHHLTAGGWLLVEEHLRWPAPVAGPGSDRFRVAPGELYEAVPDLEAVEYFEGMIESAAGPDLAVAQLLARKPEDA